MDYDRDLNEIDGEFGPIGSPAAGHMVGPLDAIEDPDYADTQLLAYLTHEMRGATTRFLALARANGHRVQPLPTAHIDPYPVKQRFVKKKPQEVSKEAIRIVFIGEDGTFMDPVKVPRTAWVDLADIASHSGLAPGYKAPFQDMTYFALHQGTTVHGAREDIELPQPWQLAVRRIPNSTLQKNTFVFTHSTLDLAHQPLEVVVELNLQKMRQVLSDRAVYQLHLQAEYLLSQGVPEVLVAAWYANAERVVLGDIARKDLSLLFLEVTRIVYGKRAASNAVKSDKDAKNLENEHKQKSTSLTDKKEEEKSTEIQSGEKVTGVLRVAGFSLTRLEIIVDAEEITLKVINVPVQWPRISVTENKSKAAGLAASVGAGLAGAQQAASLGTAAGSKARVWAFGPVATPGASVGTIIGGALSAWSGGQASREEDEASSKNLLSDILSGVLAREVERLFPVRDTSLLLKSEGGVVLTNTKPQQPKK